MAKRTIKSQPIFANLFDDTPAPIPQPAKPAPAKPKPKAASKPVKPKASSFQSFSESSSFSYQPAFTKTGTPNQSTSGIAVEFLIIPGNDAEEWSNFTIDTWWRSGNSKRKKLTNFNDTSQLNELDAKIIQLLQPNKKETTTTSFGYNTGQSNRFILPTPACSQLMPILVEQGNLYLDTGWKNRELPQINQLLGDDYKFKIIANEEHNKYIISGIIYNSREWFSIHELEASCISGYAIHDYKALKIDFCKAYSIYTEIKKSGDLHLGRNEALNLIYKLARETSLPLEDLPGPLRFKSDTPAIAGNLYIRTAKYKYRSQEQLHAELSFNYNNIRITEEDKAERIIDTYNQLTYNRDPEKEEELKLKLNELEFRYAENIAKEELGWKLHPSKLDNAVKTLVEAGWIITAQGKTYRSPTEKQATLTGEGSDWFELKGGVTFDDLEVPLPQILSAHKKGATCVRLDDGTYGLLPVEWLENYTILTELGDLTEDSLRLSRSQIAILDACIEKAGNKIQTDEHIEQARKSLNDIKGINNLQAPESFQGTLRPYQEFGLAWLNFLEKKGINGCLADDMGLGKTVQVLALLEQRRLLKTGKPTLVVLPKSLIFNWIKEAAKFTPKLKVTAHTGYNRDKTGTSFKYYHVILTTYGTLRRDAPEWTDINFDYCILDESQAIKNRDTGTTKAARLINAAHRLTMSGTPIENNIGELFSQFEFLNPGLMGTGKLGKIINKETSLTDEDLEVITKALKPYILRRTKEEVAKDLPEKSEQVLYCDLEETQQKAYDDLKEYYRKKLVKQEKEKVPDVEKIEILEALLRLRQMACHPALIKPENMHIPGAKLELITEEVKVLLAEKHKVLIFSQFTGFLALVRQKLDAANISYSYLDGSTKDREDQVRRFQEDENIEAFLISLKAGGVGLNLTAADYVFLLDPWWNPAIEAQAIDRAYRIGQKRNVFAYKVIARGTVEEKILEMQQQKKQLADSIINLNTSFIKNLTSDDINFLLS